jgi:hypothetical protein
MGKEFSEMGKRAKEMGKFPIFLIRDSSCIVSLDAGLGGRCDDAGHQIVVREVWDFQAGFS